MKIGKLFMLAIALVLAVALVAAVLTACEPDGKKGEDSTGGGDAIFTESVTLAELTEKINAAESFVWSAVETCTDSDGTSYTSRWEHRVDGKAVHVWEQFKDMPKFNWYVYSSGTHDYEASITEGVSTNIEKSLSRYGGTKNLAVELLYSFKEQYLLNWLTEVDGKIVFNEKNLVNGEDYVEGSGYVRFNGDILEYGLQFLVKDDGETTVREYAMTVSLVNAYSFEITPELKEAEKNATWAEYVSYNGVDYRKAVDETTGEEYYYVDSAYDGAVAESTINTLPVKPRR